MILTWPRVISGGFALVGAAIGGTWIVASTAYSTIYSEQARQMASQIASYEALQGAKLPVLIQDLAKVAGNANAGLELKKLQEEHDSLKKQFEAKSKLLDELSKQTTLEEEFKIQTGESRKILNKTSILGIESVYPTYAMTRFDNSWNSWNIGEFQIRTLGGIDFRITLTEISGNPLAATFQVEKVPSSGNQ
jgi:hypothetical protein